MGPLAQQIDDAVLDVRWMAVMVRLRLASDQPALPFDAAKQQWSKITRARAAFEIGAHGEPGDAGKPQLARVESSMAASFKLGTQRHWRNSFYIKKLNETRLCL